MSRIGKYPLELPKGVTVTKEHRSVVVKGPKGEVRFHWPPGVNLEHENTTLTVTRESDSKPCRAAHGTARRTLENAVRGAVEPYKRILDVVGVGYQLRLAGKQLGLKVGYANEILLDVPPGVKVDLPSVTRVEVTSCDKQAVGAFAAVIRRVRPPEPYNGKGIRYEGERIQRKSGKSFASSG